MKTVRIFLSLLVAAVMAAPALAQQNPGKPYNGARMFKCVDSAGKIYYSDKPPANCDKGTELTRQGVVIKKHGEPDSAEKHKATAAAKPVTEEGKVKLASQERRDRALMATYNSEEEIDAARDRSLAIPTQGIKTTEAKLERANQELFDMKKQADALAAGKKAIPPALLEDVDMKHRETSALEKELAQKRSNADEIRARYEADKQRYRELKPVSTTKN